MASQSADGGGRGRGAGGDIRSDGELREANGHMREFLGVLGHELRNPLAAIRNALLVLERRGEDSATRDWARGTMERQADRIGRLAEDILEISFIEHDKIRLRVQPVDLAGAVAGAVETVRVIVEERGHRLEVCLPPGPVSLDADPARLEQLLTNLLSNAAKYTEPGGRLWVTGETEGGTVVVRVRDSGVGIDPETLAHVFDPFWQAERSPADSRGGLGIGLSLVRKLAEMHGGSASASSEGLGRGSEFVVRLPARADVMGRVG